MTVEELSGKQAEELERQQALKNRIMCCTAAGCLSCGADGLRQAIAAEIAAQGRQAEVELCGSDAWACAAAGRSFSASRTIVCTETLRPPTQAPS